MADQRTSAVYLAMLAEGIKRYDEMVEAIKIVTSMNLKLTEKERKLLIVGYKNMFRARYTALRTLASIEGEELNNGNRQKMKQVQDYAEKVMAEVTQIREDLVSTLRVHVIPSATSALDYVLYNKMIGDAYRFCAEFKTGEDQDNLAKHSLTSYLIGMVRVEELRATKTIRVGLGYGLSLLYCDILEKHETALKVAKEYADAASTEMKANVHMMQTKESLKLVNLLRLQVMRCNTVLRKEFGHRAVESDDPITPDLDPELRVHGELMFLDDILEA